MKEYDITLEKAIHRLNGSEKLKFFTYLHEIIFVLNTVTTGQVDGHGELVVLVTHDEVFLVLRIG